MGKSYPWSMNLATVTRRAKHFFRTLKSDNNNCSGSVYYAAFFAKSESVSFDSLDRVRRRRVSKGARARPARHAFFGGVLVPLLPAHGRGGGFRRGRHGFAERLFLLA